MTQSKEPPSEPAQDQKAASESHAWTWLDDESSRQWLKNIGVTPQGLQTLESLRDHGRRAKAGGFWIEAISIRLYLIEYWLRVWVYLHTGRPYPTRGLMFGQLLDRAEDCHLDPDLAARIRKFNNSRNDAIHRLLAGRKRYEDLAAVFDTEPRLPDDVAVWVLDQPTDSWAVDHDVMVFPDPEGDPPEGWETGPDRNT